MKILFVTGSRGEWGYIRPIIKLCIKQSIDYQITNFDFSFISFLFLNFILQFDAK